MVEKGDLHNASDNGSKLIKKNIKCPDKLGIFMDLTLL